MSNKRSTFKTLAYALVLSLVLNSLTPALNVFAAEDSTNVEQTDSSFSSPNDEQADVTSDALTKEEEPVSDEIVPDDAQAGKEAAISDDTKLPGTEQAEKSLVTDDSANKSKEDIQSSKKDTEETLIPISTPSNAETTEEKAEEASPSNAKYPSEEMTLEYALGDMLISVFCPEGSFSVTDDSILALSVEEIKGTQLDGLVETLEEEKDIEKEDYEFSGYDIKILDSNGKELQPKKKVTVSFSGIMTATPSEASENEEVLEDVDIFHFDSDGENPAKLKTEEDNGDISVSVSHFSPFIIAVPVSSIGNLWNSAWDGLINELDFTSGDTEADAIEISDLSDLMCLSVNATANKTAVDGKYFRLTADIDLGELNEATYGGWHPIGWHKNTSDSPVGFSGHLNGDGHTISGLDIIENSGKALTHMGLFGLIDDGSVKDLTVEAVTVNGYDYVGILAGEITGTGEVHNITVSGAANTGISTTNTASSAKVGGIAGNVNGDALTNNGAVIIENCIAENIYVNSTGSGSMVGGIAGQSAKAYIVDCHVEADTNHGLQGQNYVGGIVGSMSATNIYNSYIFGTVGGNGSVCVGGVAGYFNSGDIILAQMAGELGATNKAVTHEGIFVGNRLSSSKFSYGVETADNISYLFFQSGLKGRAFNASGLSGDANGTVEKDEIGYWRDDQLYYTILEGSNEHPHSNDKYFYEELESGIRHIIVDKLGREFTVADYAKGLRFAMDHYAPSNSGSPVKGYLVSVDQIDARNASGTYDHDVATVTLMPDTTSSYYRAIDKDSAAAVQEGIILKCTTAAKNSGGNYYQMVVDEFNTPDKVKRPTYTDEDGVPQEMTYEAGGSYTFEMPGNDTEINAYYEKVLSKISLDPAETTLRIIQYRSGNRKSPSVSYDVIREDGSYLAKSVQKKTENSDDESPLSNSDIANTQAVEVSFNSVSTDNKVVWTVDDATLINLDETVTGAYTDTNAYIKPEVLSTKNTWLTTLISQAVSQQASNGYKTTIPNTVYTKKAVLTASTDPDHSVDHQSVYANCPVTVSFQIVDSTTLEVDGVSLDKADISFTITRKVTGNRRSPVSTYSIDTASSLIKATISPEDAAIKTTTWAYTGDAKDAFSHSEGGDYNHNVTITPIFTTNGSGNPAWMQTIIDNDNSLKANPATKNNKLTGSGSVSGVVTVTALDNSLGNKTATCNVTINFVTVDETEDVTALSISTDQMTFNITRVLTGDRLSPSESYIVDSPKKISASLSGGAPFLENVLWSLDGDADKAVVLSTSGTFKQEGTVAPKFDKTDVSSAPEWLYNIISSDNTLRAKDPYAKLAGSGSKTGIITVKSNDVTVPDGTSEIKTCSVTVCFTTDDQTIIHPEGVEVNPEEINRSLQFVKKGDISSATTTESGFESIDIAKLVKPNLEMLSKYTPYNRDVTWTVSDNDAVSITQEGRLSINKNASWIKDAVKVAPYKASKVVSIYCTAKDNGKVGITTLNLDFSVRTLELPAASKTINLTLTASGYRSNPTYTWSGNDSFSLAAASYPAETSVSYLSSDTEVLQIGSSGKVTVISDMNKDWIKNAMSNYPYSAVKTVNITASDGTCTDTCPVTVNFKYVNNTYSSSGGGGGGGGGSTGGSGTGVSSGTTKTTTGLPSYVISGNWIQSADKTWRFSSTGANAHTYTSEWGAIYNPYAVGDQANFDWFRFDDKSVMVTGWFTDPKDGNTYYLWPNSDNTLGHMVTGYQYISGAWYYFNEVSDSTRGKLVRNGKCPDGTSTNALGQLVVNGKVLTDPNARTATKNTTQSLIKAGIS